jgi:hypothetical protein
MPKKAAGDGTTEAATEQAKRLTISPTFDQETYDKIVAAAKEDERSPAVYLARLVRKTLTAQ